MCWMSNDHIHNFDFQLRNFLVYYLKHDETYRDGQRCFRTHMVGWCSENILLDGKNDIKFVKQKGGWIRAENLSTKNYYVFY